MSLLSVKQQKRKTITTAENTGKSEQNEIRAERALNALRYYKSDLLGEGGEPDGDEDVIDLLTDMLHLLGHENFYNCMNMANSHYNCEK